MELPEKKEIVGELLSLKDYGQDGTTYNLYLDSVRVDVRKIFYEFLNRTVKITVEIVESEE